MNILKVSSLFLAVSAAAPLAPAADFAQRQAAHERSAREGLGRAEVVLLERQAGAGREAVTQAVLQNFARSATPVTTAGTARQQASDDRLTLRGEGWSLEVFADGTSVRYRNYAHLDRQGTGRPLADRPSQETLETLGRAFVTGELAGLVELGADDALVPSFTEYLLGQGGSTRAGAQPDEPRVFAGTVVFTRTVAGVDVVGPGSKVAVLFDLEGRPFGFDYDWPVYTPASKKQAVVGIDEIRRRHDRLGAVKLAAPEVDVRHFECGYFDAGARRRDQSALVQAGCYVQAVQRRVVDAAARAADPDSGHLTSAVATAVPAGARVEPDARWPEVQSLLGQATTRRSAAPKAKGAAR